MRLPVSKAILLLFSITSNNHSVTHASNCEDLESFLETPIDHDTILQFDLICVEFFTKEDHFLQQTIDNLDFTKPETIDDVMSHECHSSFANKTHLLTNRSIQQLNEHPLVFDALLESGGLEKIVGVNFIDQSYMLQKVDIGKLAHWPRLHPSLILQFLKKTLGNEFGSEEEVDKRNILFTDPDPSSLSSLIKIFNDQQFREESISETWKIFSLSTIGNIVGANADLSKEFFEYWQSISKVVAERTSVVNDADTFDFFLKTQYIFNLACTLGLDGNESESQILLENILEILKNISAAAAKAEVDTKNLAFYQLSSLNCNKIRGLPFEISIPNELKSTTLAHLSDVDLVQMIQAKHNITFAQFPFFLVYDLGDSDLVREYLEAFVDDRKVEIEAFIDSAHDIYAEEEDERVSGICRPICSLGKMLSDHPQHLPLLSTIYSHFDDQARSSGKYRNENASFLKIQTFYTCLLTSGGNDAYCAVFCTNLEQARVLLERGFNDYSAFYLNIDPVASESVDAGGNEITIAGTGDNGIIYSSLILKKILENTNPASPDRTDKIKENLSLFANIHFRTSSTGVIDDGGPMRNFLQTFTDHLFDPVHNFLIPHSLQHPDWMVPSPFIDGNIGYLLGLGVGKLFQNNILMPASLDPLVIELATVCQNDNISKCKSRVDGWVQDTFDIASIVYPISGFKDLLQPPCEGEDGDKKDNCSPEHTEQYKDLLFDSYLKHLTDFIDSDDDGDHQMKKNRAKVLVNVAAITRTNLSKTSNMIDRTHLSFEEVFAKNLTREQVLCLANPTANVEEKDAAAKNAPTYLDFLQYEADLSKSIVENFVDFFVKMGCALDACIHTKHLPFLPSTLTSSSLFAPKKLSVDAILEKIDFGTDRVLMVPSLFDGHLIELESAFSIFLRELNNEQLLKLLASWTGAALDPQRIGKTLGVSCIPADDFSNNLGDIPFSYRYDRMDDTTSSMVINSSQFVEILERAASAQRKKLRLTKEEADFCVQTQPPLLPSTPPPKRVQIGTCGKHLTFVMQPCVQFYESIAYVINVSSSEFRG